jgi:pimeloyl-ACP methyl ester carboxylesterase
MGLGGQLIRWNLELVEELVHREFRVIRFDNRDVGLSTRCDELPVPDLAGLMRGEHSQVAYTLATMAGDCVGLLDGLNIRQAHIVGASMGGAIAQIIAANFPARALSLTSIMSSSGNPLLPPPTPAAMMALFAPLPANRDRSSIVADAIARHRVIGSPAFPVSEEVLSRLYGDEFDRGFYPRGVARQLAALLTDGDRRSMLGTIRCATCVLHGVNDPLIPFACGEDVANAMPGAKLCAVEGMGHDLPLELTNVFADAICTVAN